MIKKINPLGEQSFLSIISLKKCNYYDKGYCKLNEQCKELHPSTDCDGVCVNQKTCPLKHRIVCKNGNDCIFKASTSCSFLHPQIVLLDDTKIVLVEKTVGYCK